MKLLLLSAFPREIRKAVRMIGRGEKIDGLPFKAFSVHHPSHTLTVAETGMGYDNAMRVFLRLLQVERPDAVISLGYCGALSHDALIGDLIWASMVCLIEGQRVDALSLPDDLNLLQRLSLSLPIRPGTFFTMKDWMKKHELANFIAPHTQLPVCDMETFGLARLSISHQLPFIAIRAVTDGADMDLPSGIMNVCDKDGVYRLSLALKFFLARPHLIPHAIELGHTSRIASHSLSRAVSTLLQLI